MLEVKNLQVAYGPLLALHGVDLIIRPGEMVALVGPNGAGKSTLLKSISGLLAPRAGAIRWQDENNQRSIAATDRRTWHRAGPGRTQAFRRDDGA